MSCSSNKKYLIAIDIGNSRIKYGLFHDDFDQHPDRLPVCFRKVTLTANEAIVWDDLIDDDVKKNIHLTRSLIAGANPVGIKKIQKNWLEGLPAAQIVDRSELVPVINKTDNPEKVGIDRLLNCVAINSIRPKETPAIIIDSGTATTVDLISSAGAFEGGAILPGFELSTLSLHHYTKQLPLLSMKEMTSQQPSPFGRNTFAALSSGIFWGQVGATKELVSQIQSTLSHRAIIYITGGGGKLLLPHIPHAQFEPELSLQGIALMGK